MADLLTQADFAKRRGVGKSAVSNWKKAGLLVFAEDEAGRMFVHVARTEARLNSRIDPMRGRPATSPQSAAAELPMDGNDGADGDGSVSLRERSLARVRAEVAEEDLVGKRMNNARAAGELVPAVEAERRLGGLARMARERVLSELRSKAERLAAEREPRAIMVLIEETVDRAFHALSRMIAAGALNEPEEEEETAEAA